MTKRCGRCGEKKARDGFHRWHKGDSLQPWCKSCGKVYDAEYHRRKRAIRREQKKVRRAEFVAWYVRLKAGKPCTDCGPVFHPDAMHWDHLPGVPKVSPLGELYQKNNKRRILEEIANCELVCANCHAVRTFVRRRGVAQPG